MTLCCAASQYILNASQYISICCQFTHQKLCIKWDSILPEKFSVSNGINKGCIVQYQCQYFKHEFALEVYRFFLNGNVVNHSTMQKTW